MFYGDRQVSYPVTLAHEVIVAGLSLPEVRDEILLQNIKQLTDNSSPFSVDRGWLLLSALLNYFPPSETFENYLELFLRRQVIAMRVMDASYASMSSAIRGDAIGLRDSNPQGEEEVDVNIAALCLKRLHAIVFRGAAKVSPSLQEVI